VAQDNFSDAVFHATQAVLAIIANATLIIHLQLLPNLQSITIEPNESVFGGKRGADAKWIH
jgi:hypothetical protein